jgi:hypothetical protein
LDKIDLNPKSEFQLYYSNVPVNRVTILKVKRRAPY